MVRESDSDSPVKGRGSFNMRSPFQRERSSARRKRSLIIRSLERTCSPSSRIKRLQRYQAYTEVDREREDRQYSSNKEEDKERHKEKGGDTEGDKRYREIGGDGEDPRNIRDKMSREINNVENSRSREDHRGFKAGNFFYLHMDAGDISVTKMKDQKSSFKLSGKLAKKIDHVEVNQSFFISDARIPVVIWRFYVLKGGEVINALIIHIPKTCYLFERERRATDIPADHSSCSKQHAIVEEEKHDGMLKKKVRVQILTFVYVNCHSPYIINLGSTNRTFINEYLELHENLIERYSVYEGSVHASKIHYVRAMTIDTDKG
ncbi:hypothetical protein MKW98_020352 [Papaver atlanticum]|uniref:FHA domain-containing protein n=1 Tax=Papaver atlanticum TaxID=357466 RepID=A0AAD4RVA9_9MAGN|nr:hypothetical protein MKW98_020352 [Papaver atlanticum]